ncbi:MAG: glutamate--tRNA ligase [Candidatus Shikimatogenerans bostrichidophilus]|nr:MAG: glutamate--tRNA ligase [Candidatus Shikimatogenerans bostrichidophilus]
MKNKIRVRFAPSPTGPLHIGGLRTALYNYLFAKKNNGTFILRIEDTDKKRLIKNSKKYIIDSLKWCKIKYDEGYKKKGKYGPYIQSKRLNIYKKYLKILIKKKLVYFCFDNKKDIIKYKKKYKNFLYNSLTRKKLKNTLNKKKIFIKKKFKKYVIRIKTPKNKNIIFYDKIYGKIKINTNKIDDKIIYRSDKTPTYHFANVIDDYLMNITHIIRGKEWIYSTPIHIIIYNYFKWKIPIYIHLPLILNNKKQKISKRNFNIKKNIFPIYPIKSKYKNLKIKNSYEEIGILPESLLNKLLLLGFYSNKINNNILNLKQMIKLFTFKNVNKSDIIFNYKKLCWINKIYIKNNKVKIIKKIFILLINKIKKKKKYIKYNNIKINKIINLILNRIKLINIKNIWNVCKYFFKKPDKYVINKNLKKKIINFKTKILFYLLKINFFYIKKKKINLFKKIKKINKKYIIIIFKILRISIIGNLKGINIIYIFKILNNKEIINRINIFIIKNKKLFTNTKFRKNII